MSVITRYFRRENPITIDKFYQLFRAYIDEFNDSELLADDLSGYADHVKLSVEVVEAVYNGSHDIPVQILKDMELRLSTAMIPRVEYVEVTTVSRDVSQAVKED